MKKIVYLQYLPLTIKIEKDLLIPDLISAGFKVEYLDISMIYFPDIVLADTISRSYIKKISSLNQLKEWLINEDIKELIIFPQITYEYKVVKLFRILTKFKCPLYFFARSMVLTNTQSKNLLNNLKNIAYKKNIFTINYYKIKIGNLMAYIYKKLKLVKDYDVIFNSGSYGFRGVGIGSNLINKQKTKMIQVNSVDYDSYLDIKNNNNRIIMSKYCVFLDEYLPFHPDSKMFNLQNINVEEYYNSINKFFQYLENEIGIEVVIAAHPKSEYEDKIFNGRKIYKYKTSELVKNSEFVIAHMSSSISFAVLFYKPILFVYTSNMRLWGQFKEMINYAEEFNLNIYEVDKINYLPKIKLGERQAFQYDEFKYNYLTSYQSENKKTKDIFIEYLLRREREIVNN